MPVRYRILLSRQVAKDLQEIFDYIALQSPQYAARVVERILNAVAGLKTFPHRTIVQGQSAKRKHPIRSLPVQSWIIFFTVRDDQKVFRILRVRHGSRRQQIDELE